MEFHERLSFLRKAAGLTQEQLGARVGVTRQAVSKWESGQVSPDAATVARLCGALNVSADFLVLGREPVDAEDGQEPETCPICGRPVYSGLCSGCGYRPRPCPEDPNRYALITTQPPVELAGYAQDLIQFCGLEREDADARIESARQDHRPMLLQRGLEKPAVLFLAAHVRRVYGLRIVADQGEPEETLLKKPGALHLPATIALTERIKREQSFPFWQVLLTVILGAWIASFL